MKYEKGFFISNSESIFEPGSVTMQVNVHEAKTHFSRLLGRVELGEEITIAKAGKPVARLVPVKSRKGRRIPGTAKGKIFLAENFDEPLPEEIIRSFES